MTESIEVKDEELRSIEKKQDDSWVKVRMMDLRKGDIFRMFENDDKPVADGQKWEVIEPPYTNPQGVAEVMVVNADNLDEPLTNGFNSRRLNQLIIIIALLYSSGCIRYIGCDEAGHRYVGESCVVCKELVPWKKKKSDNKTN